MSTTLTNGLKLPDKGSVDWYADMQNNYAILDGAVGTVAEHTTALAGKAPAVHTHTKADITDFPSYGTTAGTICEGNDSRLSDARTPVAHTHTKSDVTDLLNSDFIPSATNSYDLGSSSYQWKSVYAQSYYYNGTEFQNKFVTLDTPQTISANKTFTGEVRFQASNLYHIAEDPYNVLKSSTMQEGVVPSGDRTAYTGHWLDKDSSILGYDRFVFYSAGVQTYEVNLRNKATNGSFSPSGSRIQSGLQLALQSNGNSEFKIYAHTLPNGNGTWNLGDSTHKWKTLNGINPGALSLPNLTANSPATQNPPNGWISIDTTDWDKTGNLISYIPPVDGWISIITDNSSATNYIRCAYDNGNILAKANGNGYAQGLSVFLPVLKNVQISIRLVCTTIGTAKLYPCQGNV